MTTRVISLTNVAVPQSPPTHFAPNSNGVSINPSLKSWVLNADLGGTIPAGQILSVTIEYQRNAWTDNAGISHPAGEWLPDSGADWVTGSLTDKSGNTTTIHSLASTIGATDVNGAMVEPYPTHVRLRINQAGAWTIPTITLDLN